jgi:Protein of unknown function (DUF3089).
MNKVLLLCSFLALMTLSSCEKADVQESFIDYSNGDFWYSKDDSLKAVDIFYVYPSVTTVSYKDNHESWVADIRCDSVRREANGNQRFNKMLYDDYNFYAPYYRQMIYEVYQQPEGVMEEGQAIASADVKAAFQHYMKHFNHGRPFMLVGHSQGSQMLIELLKYGMTDEQFQHMVAAYCIGYRLSEEDLRHYSERLSPACDSTGIGQIIMFNSVTKIDAASDIMKGNVVGINPLNWRVDSTFAPKELHLGMAKYNDSRDSICIIPNVTGGSLQDYMVVCSDLPDDFCYSESFADDFPIGNLHFADSWLYAGNIKQNMACRVRHFLKQ